MQRRRGGPTYWAAVLSMPRAEALAELDAFDRSIEIGLVSVTEIAQRLGRSADAIHQARRRHADFPAPLVTLATGPVWAWSDVERWAAIPRPGGRPRKER